MLVRPDALRPTNTDAEFDAALGRQACVALDEAVLHLDGAAHRVDQAAKLDEAAVAGSFDEAPVMRVDGRVDQIAAQPTEPRQRAILIRSRQPAVANDIRDQNRRDLPRSRHSGPSGVVQDSTKPVGAAAYFHRRPLSQSDRPEGGSPEPMAA